MTERYLQFYFRNIYLDRKIYHKNKTYGCGFEPIGVSIRCKLAEHAFSPAEFSALHVYSHSSFSLTRVIANK
jgi:hypothetical protein